MEVLSGVASGMAVVSLSMQLVQSIGAIKTFIRDVKGASKELERLIESLDRLSALLNGVSQMAERQSALSDQRLPVSLDIIFRYLKSCETSLSGLQESMDKYKRSDPGIPAMTKWKGDIRFSFGKKEIAVLEARIQQEIGYLHMAMNLNSTNLL
jgi:heme exporter protein D